MFLAAIELTTIDWVIIVGFFALALGIGVMTSRQAGKSESDFFLGGRNLPWWMLGLSMVATTFSTDTPNYVTNVVRETGVARNWEWWAFLITGMLTVFVYAKLWRRSSVTTDVEFYELRYSGKSAAFLRGFRAFYLGVVYNVLIMAMVGVAAIKIGGVMLGLNPYESLIYASLITMVFSVLGGFKGVLLTDCVLFFLAMLGAFAAAYYALGHEQVGGISGMMTHFQANEELADKLNILPALDNTEMWLTLLIIPLAVQWWASYYPGSEPGGGGYLVQRMLASKDEKNALGATLFFNIAHYALRPWPWIIVALCSLIVFPMDSKADRDAAADALKAPAMVEQVEAYNEDTKAFTLAQPEVAETIRALKFQAAGTTSLRESFDDKAVPDDKVAHDLGYSAMLTLIPAGWIGLIIASLAAAYMSTISTHLNWGSSYVVNDLYLRFVKPEASQKELVWVGRLSTVLLMVLAAVLALFIKSAAQAFQMVILLGAGTGLIYILRWFWWRINAWSEITGMLVSLVVVLTFIVLEKQGVVINGKVKLLLGVGITTFAWIAVTLMTTPVNTETLYNFIERINPAGPGWGKVRGMAAAQGRQLKSMHKPDSLSMGVVGMLAGCLLVYGALFATGYVIYSQWGKAIVGMLVALVGTAGIIIVFKKLGDDDTPPEALEKTLPESSTP